MSGALATPLAQAMKQVAISGPLGSTMPTRSLRPMPPAFSAASKAPGATSPQEAYHSGGAKANLRKGASAMPQDVRLSPNGKYFLAADMLRNGVWVIDAASLEFTKFIQTGKGAHSIYPSRDAKRLFVANRDEGTISVLDSESLDILAKWTIPGGGSPDMGGVTADGKELWLSGRYHAEV